MSLEPILSPSLRIASALGPMNVTPRRVQRSAKAGSSATKPQPTQAASAWLSVSARSRTARSMYGRAEAGPSGYASSASRANMAVRSSSVCSAIVRIGSPPAAFRSRTAWMSRIADSPRFTIAIRLNTRWTSIARPASGTTPATLPRPRGYEPVGAGFRGSGASAFAPQLTTPVVEVRAAASLTPATPAARGATMRQAGPVSTAEDRVRAICTALPEVTEKNSHGSPAFFVGKQFVMLWHRGHHDHDFPHLWCAAPVGAQEELVASAPDRVFRPPYVGHRGWLGVRLDGAVDWDEVAELCQDAYRAVAPRRLVALLDAEP